MTGTSNDDISGYLSGDVIKVYVGPKRKRYSVHKALLTQYEWFRNKILYGSLIFRDSIDLLAEDPKVFELLIGWLYRNYLNAISTTDEEVAEKEVALSVDLYLRACEWDMPELQNALMDRMKLRTTCVHGFFPRKLIKTIYESTESLSPLRSYIVDSFIYKGIQWDEDAEIEDPIYENFFLTRKSVLRTQLDAGNQEFVLDCYEALFQLCAKSEIRDPDRRTGCVYHAHKRGGRSAGDERAKGRLGRNGNHFNGGSQATVPIADAHQEFRHSRKALRSGRVV